MFVSNMKRDMQLAVVLVCETIFALEHWIAQVQHEVIGGRADLFQELEQALVITVAGGRRMCELWWTRCLFLSAARHVLSLCCFTSIGGTSVICCLVNHNDGR